MVSTKYRVDVKEKEKWTTPLQDRHRSTKKPGETWNELVHRQPV